MTRRSGMLVVLGVTAILAVGAAAPLTPPPPWQARYGQDHPLVGRIWDVGAGAFIDPSTLAARLALPRFVLLGERHDNADHHRLQAWLLQNLVLAGRRPAVVWEMLTPDQMPALDRHLAGAPRDAAGLGDAVGWPKTGWPDWTLYQPIAQVALDADLPLLAGAFPSATTHAMRREGLTALDQDFVSRSALDQPLPADLGTALSAEIRDGHCGHAPEAILPRMVAMQRAVDARLAEALLEARGDGAALIAGNGHVRTDWGVPLYLRHRQPEAAIASVGLLEVQDDRRDPAAYARGTRIPYDYVWFTPRAGDEDPCEKFRKTLERLRERGGDAGRGGR